MPVLAKRGISVLDLLGPAIGAPSAAQALIPADIASFLEKLSVIEHTSTSSTGAHVHYGTLQSAKDVLGLPGLDDFIVESSALTEGLPFQLTVTRAAIPAPAAVGGFTIEAGATAFQLDLFFDRLSIRIHRSILRPADRIPSSGSTPAYLVPDGGRSQVRIVGSGTIRIASTPTGSVAVTFIDRPDTFDPTAPTGVVTRVSFEPAHFFIAQSEFGLTVERLTYDGSTTFTPPVIVARGHTDTWRGIAISEATVYFPRNAPLLGDVSLGVRDVLLGSPAGIQGDLFIEFGRTPVSPSAVTFRQHVQTGEQSLAVGAGSGTGGADNTVLVTLAVGTAGRARVRAEIAQAQGSQLQLTDAWWQLPDDRLGRHQAQKVTVGSTPTLVTRWFEVSDGEVARLTLMVTSGTQTVALPEITYTFERPSATAGLPKIDVSIQTPIAGPVFENVVSVSGSAAALRSANLVFSTPANTSVSLPFLVWDLENSPVPQAIHGGSVNANYKPAIPTEPGYYYLHLIDGARQRRCRINVLQRGALVVGCKKGVFDVDGNAIAIRSVAATHALHVFHDEGIFASASADATLSSGTLTVPDGALATVLLERGTADDPDASPPPPKPPLARRHFQMFFPFKEADGSAGTAVRPPKITIAPEPAVGRENELLAWAAKWTGATFFVIGRCDDVGAPGKTTNDPASITHNKKLADRRAAYVATLLEGKFPSSIVYARGEQSPWPTGAPSSTPDDVQQWEMVKGGHVPEGQEALLSEAKQKREDRDHRPYFRRVDVFADGGTAASDAPVDPRETENTPPSLRLALVPGNDLAATKADPREPKLPWRVRLLVRWDSPTAVGPADLIPTMAEVTVSWTAANVALPGTSQQFAPGGSAGETYTLIGRWAYDARGGETTFSLSLDSSGDPDGLRKIVDGQGTVDRLVAVAMGLGPALAAGIGAAGLDGGAVRVAALLAASGALTFVTKSGKVVLHGVKLEQRQRALNEPWTGSRQRILVDYSVEIGYEAPAPGGLTVKTQAGRPMRVRYKNVGLQWDHALTGLAAVGFVYENVSFEIEDSGGWTITGPLGEILRVVATRAGASSNWLEVDLAFVIDMGVVRITGATVRVTFDANTIGVSLRGLSVAVDVPGTLKGEGRLALAPNGDIRAGLDVEIIPAKVKARAGLAFNPATNFVSIDVTVIFAVGIPLGNSGLGVYGFTGRFVSNGTRDLSGLPTNDPIGRELGWYRKPPEQKYRSERGQFALGVGALVGTLPDAAFTFNALGALTVSFPDVTVIFGIDAKLVSPVTVSVPEQGSTPTTGTLLLLGLISIDKSAIVVGVLGTYDIPHLLNLRVPAGAYFPIPPNNADSYVRVGADNVEGRVGDPVQMRILPDTLDAQAWGFLMVEQRKLHKLGGDDRLNFDGFSIGFGAGFGVEWRSGPFRLAASALVLVGLGTKPLMLVGTVDIRGEIDLVVVSIEVHGGVLLEVYEDRQRLQGKLCASVNLFLKKVEGCVSIDIGQAPAAAIPPPDPLVTGIDLTDRRGIVQARAAVGGVAPSAANTVWPDTVPVIHFGHRPKVALASTSAFSPGQPPAGELWSGTSELKYAFRLDSVVLKKGGTAVAGPLDSVWWWPTHRGGVLTTTGDAPSQVEGADLALLSWHPAPWARNLGTDGAQAPADPAKTVAVLCEPPPVLSPVCALGANASWVDLDVVQLAPDGPSAPPFSGYFDVLGREGIQGADLETVALSVAELGMWVERGGTAPLYKPLSVPGRTTPVTEGYRISYIDRPTGRYTTLEFEGTLAPVVVKPELTLELCLDAPVPEQQVTTCYDYSTLTPGSALGASFVHEGIAYQSLGGTTLTASDVIAPAGTAELAFSPFGLRADLPTDGDPVTVVVAQFNNAPFVVRALDKNGVALDQSVASPAVGVPMTVSVAGPKIARIEIVSQGAPTSAPAGAVTAGTASLAGGAARVVAVPTLTENAFVEMPGVVRVVVSATGAVLEPPSVPEIATTGTVGTAPPSGPQLVLVQLCITETHQPPAFNASSTSATTVMTHLPGTSGVIPSVVGVRADGTESAWAAAVLTAPASTEQCGFVRYVAPDDGPWSTVRVEAWPNGDVKIVSVCGATWDAVEKRKDDSANRQQAASQVNAHSGTPTPRSLLDADAEYTIEVKYSYRGWRSTGPGDRPPALNGAWTTVPTQSFRFRTAKSPAQLSNDPEIFLKEGSFDPRNLLRYIIAFDPDGASVRHFVDDPVRVHLQVDHAEQLLGKYGRKLALRVRRTDPPAGSLAAVTVPPNVPTTVALASLPKELLDGSDARIVDAAAASPCLSVPNLGGASMTATATLEPSAEYDVLLAAPPSATPNAEGILIARAHFRTSRYRSERELLVALGFDVAGSSPVAPKDVLVGAALPTSASLESDQDLDLTLRALGLDPWPLARVPRTVALWRNPSAWTLAGVLIEADEPIARPRLALTSLKAGATTLNLVRSSAASTRLLFAMPSIGVLAATAELTLTVTPQGGASITARRALGAAPGTFVAEIL